jgi:hypothetical protein
MRRVLLDEGVPIGVRWLVAGFPVDSAAELGWAGLAHGDLIEVAEQAGYDVMITADQNISYQQNLTGRRLALIVLMSNHWDTIRANAEGSSLPWKRQRREAARRSISQSPRGGAGPIPLLCELGRLP